MYGDFFSDSFDTRCVIVRTLHEIVILMEFLENKGLL